MDNLQYHEKCDYNWAAGVRRRCGEGMYDGVQRAWGGHAVIELWLEMICTKECTIHRYKLLIFIEFNSTFLSRGWGVGK